MLCLAHGLRWASDAIDNTLETGRVPTIFPARKQMAIALPTKSRSVPRAATAPAAHLVVSGVC
jgi:hypothetical protein